MPEWDDTWNDYMHMLFAVDENQNILGTFFSKGDFIFLDKTITGTNVMWLPTQNENYEEYYFDNVVVPPNNIKYLFHRDSTSNIKKIYEVTDYTDYTNDSITLKYKIYEIPTVIENIEYKSNLTTEELTQKITNTHAKIRKGLTTLDRLKIKRGGSIHFGLNEKDIFEPTTFKPIEDLVDDFDKFIDAFITHPTVLKLNSLSVDQVNMLFGTKIVIDGIQITESNQIKKIIFEFLFYFLQIDYTNKNAEMEVDVKKEFINEINSYSTEINKSFNDIKSINIYNDNIIESLTDNSKIIHIKYLANIFKEIILQIKSNLESENKLKIDIYNDVIDIIVSNIYKISDNFLNKYSLNGSGENSNRQKDILGIITGLVIKNEDFITTFNKFIEKNVSDKILTYVKINNLDHNFDYSKKQFSKWNKRFNILLNNITTSSTNVVNTMIVHYNDINKAYYSDIGEPITGIDEKIYTKKYVFGRFSQIFPPNMKNPDIADKMTQIIDKVKEGKPVFIMGYGASGSGKTSSLIYLDSEGRKEDGIIIDICKKICEDSFDKLELTTQELFTNNEPTNAEPEKASFENCDTISNIIKCISNEYTFKYDKNIKDSFVLENNGKTETIKHPYRIPGNVPKSFGEIMKYLIDSDRLVNATTNNPQSSRSHSFAFIRFLNSNSSKESYLIVGDFAGVENVFNCENVATIKNFLNVKNTKTNKPYYGGGTSEFTQFVNDIIITYLNELLRNKSNAEYKQLLKNLNEYFGTNIENNTQTTKLITSKDLKTQKIEFLNINKTNIKNVFGKDPILKNDGRLKKLYAELDQNEDLSIAKYLDDIEEQTIRSERLAQQKARRAQFAQSKKKEKQQIAQAKKLEDEQIAQAKKIEDEQIAQAKKIEDKRIAQEKEEKRKEKMMEMKKIEEEKERLEKEAFDVLSKNEIDENYLKKQIDKIYEGCKITEQDKKENKENKELIKYETYLEYYMNNPQKLQDPIRDATNFTTEEIKDYFYEWIYEIMEDFGFVNNNITINVHELMNNDFKKLFDNIDKIKNAITIKESKMINDEIKNLEKNYIPASKVKTPNYTSNQGNWNDIINEYEIEMFSVKINTPNLAVINKDTIRIFIKNNIKTSEYNKKRSDIISKTHFLSDTYMSENKTTNFKSNLFNLENEILKKINFILDAFKNRLTYGQKICAYRRHEGYFINQSLKEMREDIKNIFYVKQSDSIFISPNYVNLCLEKYCPTHSDCFKNDVQQKNIEIKSVIFQKIFEYLDNKKYFDNVTIHPDTLEYLKVIELKKNKTKKFYEDILISVFCVLNISPSANNPPPVPYIDINELKISLKMYDKYADGATKAELIKNLVKTYYKVTDKNLEGLDEIQNENSFDEIQTSSIRQITFDKSKNEKKNIIEYIFTDETSLLKKINTTNKLTPDDFNKLNIFIESIDNNNAISAIGTLEFLDQISKYYTTNTICFLESNQYSGSDYLPIYDKDGVFNAKFNNPKNLPPDAVVI
jgi:hypothetical protein